MTPETPAGPGLFLAVFLVIAILFPLVPLLLARLWARRYSPAKPGPDKNAVYECGLESKGDALIQFRSAYYLYAVIFLVFDVEIVFFYPWATVFPDAVVRRTPNALALLIEMMVFVVILLVAYFYAWGKGVFKWD